MLLHAQEDSMVITVLARDSGRLYAWVIAFLIHKWHRRHLSMYDDVRGRISTNAQQPHANKVLLEIKKMTKSFKDKLSEEVLRANWVKEAMTLYIKGMRQSGRLVVIRC
jgi:hypothetical protein